MKRSFVGLHQSRAADEEARTRLKHQTLLEEYLQLQKEFVSMKRELKIVMKRRDTLVAEVRFLARRRQYLLKTQSLNLKLEDHPQAQNSDTPSKILEKNRKGIIKAAALGHPYLGLVSSADMRVEEKERKEREQFGGESLTIDHNLRNWLVHEKRVGKKKISWHDDISLKV